MRQSLSMEPEFEHKQNKRVFRSFHTSSSLSAISSPVRPKAKSQHCQTAMRPAKGCTGSWGWHLQGRVGRGVRQRCNGLLAVGIASKGCPGLLSGVVRTASFQPWQCVAGRCERAPAALFAATGALPYCVAGLDGCALAVSQVSWPSSASSPNVLWLYRIIVNFLRTPLQVIHVELLAVRVEYRLDAQPVGLVGVDELACHDVAQVTSDASLGA